MLFDKEGIDSSHTGRKRSRTLPTAPNDNFRSKSLPKTRDKSFPGKKFKDNPNPVTKVNQSLSQSMYTLSKPGIVKPLKQDSGEVPVIVDDVTREKTAKESK